MELVAHSSVYVCPFVVVDVLVFHEKTGIGTSEHTSASVGNDAVIVGIVARTRCRIGLTVVIFSLKTVAPRKLLEVETSVTAYG